MLGSSACDLSFPTQPDSKHRLDITLGVKSYPRGVTTNSEGGIESYEVYYPVFEVMQEVGLVLNLHGEVPTDITSVSSTSHSS